MKNRIDERVFKKMENFQQNSLLIFELHFLVKDQKTSISLLSFSDRDEDDAYENVENFL
jgi:hypothetical protein